LAEALTTDVLVIGGGLAGCAAAHHLARAGVEALLVEWRDLNTQASGANSGSIHAQIPNEPFTTLGEGWTAVFAPTVRLMLHAIEVWRAVGAELGVDLEVDQSGGLVVARTPAEMAALARKAAIESAQGLQSHLLDAADLARLAPYVAPDMVGGYLYPVEGKANPLLAAPAFARAARALGARIVTGCRVLSIELLPRGGFLVATSRGPIQARRVLDCAGAEAGAIAAMVGLDLPIAAYPIQTSITDPAPPLVRHLLYAAGEKLSVKQNRLGQILIGGGWDARLDAAGRPVADMRSLILNLRVALGVVPDLASIAVVRTWAAVVNGTDDWKPLLGEAPRVPGFHLCFFPWMGFTAGPAVARAVVDRLLCRAPAVDLGPFLLRDR
jgi:glycine/D-amino acid oxidase-like deaminating enzyme